MLQQAKSAALRCGTTQLRKSYSFGGHFPPTGRKITTKRIKTAI
jgi:hypothetical protein